MFHPAHGASDLLAEWRWLVGGRPQLLGWSSAGDLFFVDEHERVYRLDTGAGDQAVVAESVAEFEELLRDGHAVGDLLLLPVVEAFESKYGELATDHCLGFKTPPVLGGEYSVENMFALKISEHASFTGDLHRQIRDLPDGTATRLSVEP